MSMKVTQKAEWMLGSTATVNGLSVKTWETSRSSGNPMRGTFTGTADLLPLRPGDKVIVDGMGGPACTGIVMTMTAHGDGAVDVAWAERAPSRWDGYTADEIISHYASDLAYKRPA